MLCILEWLRFLIPRLSSVDLNEPSEQIQVLCDGRDLILRFREQPGSERLPRDSLHTDGTFPRPQETRITRTLGLKSTPLFKDTVRPPYDRWVCRISPFPSAAWRTPSAYLAQRIQA
jgi:hypothetical protein